MPEDLGAAMTSGQALARDRFEAEPQPAPAGAGTDSPGLVFLSRRAVILWAAGLAFAMVWVFILGVLVGRGTIYENAAYQKLEDRLGVPKPPEAPPPQVVVSEPAPQTETPADGSEEKLTFYDSLVKTKPKPVTTETRPKSAPPEEKPRPQPEPKPEPPAALPPNPEPAAPTAQPKPAPGSAPPPAPAEKKTAAPAPQVVVTSGVKTVKPEESAAPPPARKPGENFTVQVAAAPTVEEAQRIVAKLKKQGFNAYFYQVEEKGRRYMRVRVGRYRTRQEAQEAVDKLAALGRKGLFISTLVD
ncbi:MAG: SPOR domain-containing protein [Thermodesulfobacteriota bacterium]